MNGWAKVGPSSYSKAPYWYLFQRSPRRWILSLKGERVGVYQSRRQAEDVVKTLESVAA